MVVAVTLLAAWGPSVTPAGALAGGTQTPVGQYPWTVSIALPSGCTGALIAPTWVLTAAHCALASETPVVRVGSWSVASGGEQIAVRAQFQAPGWAPDPEHPEFGPNDVMLMELATPATQPTLALARPDQAAAWAPGTAPTFAGFGVSCGFLVYGDPSCDDVETDAMHDAPLPVIAPARCASDYPESVIDPAVLLCTATTSGGVSPCFGDSGGALIATTPEGPVAAGVISGGGDPCGAPNAPAVFGRVTAFLDWIASVSGVVPPDPPPLPTTTTTTTTLPTAASTSTTLATTVPKDVAPAAATPVIAMPRLAG